MGMEQLERAIKLLEKDISRNLRAMDLALNEHDYIGAERLNREILYLENSLAGYNHSLMTLKQGVV